MNYNSVIAEAPQPAGWSPGESADFVLDFPGRALVPNSIRLEGDLVVTQAGVPLTLEDIRVNNHAGVHALIESTICSTDMQGTLETAQDYSRVVKAISQVTTIADDMIRSDFLTELRTPSDLHTRELLKGIPIEAGTSVYPDQTRDFSLKPLICFNRSDGPISQSKTGALRISFRFARVVDAFYGFDFSVANTSYTLTNLRVSYMTMPAPAGKGGSVAMRSFSTLRQTVSSQSSSLSTKAPVKADAVSIVFIAQEDSVKPLVDPLALQEIENIERVEVWLQDDVSGMISFPMTSRAMILQHFLRSFRASTSTDTSLRSLRANEGFGIGMLFDSMKDLSADKFSLNITSAVNSTRPFFAYMIFHSAIAI